MVNQCWLHIEVVSEPDDQLTVTVVNGNPWQRPLFHVSSSTVSEIEVEELTCEINPVLFFDKFFVQIFIKQVYTFFFLQMCILAKKTHQRRMRSAARGFIIFTPGKNQHIPVLQNMIRDFSSNISPDLH
jgi:hypothetical protein